MSPVDLSTCSQPLEIALAEARNLGEVGSTEECRLLVLAALRAHDLLLTSDSAAPARRFTSC